MIRHEVIIDWSNDGQFYLAEVSGLPSCMADGAIYQEALNNIKIVIQVGNRSLVGPLCAQNQKAAVVYIDDLS